MARKPEADTANGDVPNISPELMAEAVAETIRLNSEKARLANKYKVHWRKYESVGIVKDRVVETVRRSGMTSEEVAAENREQMRYDIAAGVIKLADAEWTSSVQQGDMGFVHAEHGSDADLTLARALAYRAGYETALIGGPVENCPHLQASESEQYVAWRDGWADGVDDRIKAKPEAAKERTASTRRSRKKADADPIGDTAGNA